MTAAILLTLRVTAHHPSGVMTFRIIDGGTVSAAAPVGIDGERPGSWSAWRLASDYGVAWVEVPGEVRVKVELEVEDDQTELEIELSR
jgi:hypothetical protein